MRQIHRITPFLSGVCVLLCALMLSPLSAAALGVLPAKNTEARHQLCTQLSEEAQAYYSGAYGYESLLQLDGAGDASDSYAAMQNNPLFEALHTLMTDTHRYYTTYSGYKSGSLAYFWSSTDAVAEHDSYTLFYSDLPYGADVTMNREHIWPKSHASFQTTRGGADLHHLRPSLDTVNNAKRDHIFGDIDGVFPGGYTTGTIDGQHVYYLNSGEDLFECKDDVKGDVARILLYVYCRWEQPNLYSSLPAEQLPAFDPDDATNSGVKVIESLDTLLQWCESDPVDTWEMKRNDLTQEVQGNRNVFIDYPELAWQLFDKELPTGMATPTHEGCRHHYELSEHTAPLCEADGCDRFCCTVCGNETVKRIAPTGHADADADGVCDHCHTALTLPAAMTCAEALHDGDHLVLYHPSTATAIGKSINANGKMSIVPIAVKDGVLRPTAECAVMTVHAAGEQEIYLQIGGKYLSVGADGKSLCYTAEQSGNSLWRLTPSDNSGQFYLDNANATVSGKTARLQTYRGNTTVNAANTTASFRFACYTLSAHVWDDGVVTKEPSVAEDGAKRYTCLLCGEEKEEPLPTLAMLCGDANLDGKVDILDVTVIQRCLAEYEALSDPAALCADINGGGVTIDDATLIQQYLAEFSPQAPIGQPILS